MKAYKRMKGTKDVLRHAPNLIPSRSGQHLDQTVWYLECMQNNVHSSDWILIADTDEFLIPDYEAMEPSKQLGEFLGAQEEHIGDIVLDRIEMIKPQADKSADSNIELYQSEFTCAHSGRSMFKSVAEGRHHVKTLYRSHAVARFNQHRHIEMFPLPPATASKQGLNQGHLWQSFDQASYTDGVWPKLVHYRVSGLARPRASVTDPSIGRPGDRVWTRAIFLRQWRISHDIGCIFKTFDETFLPWWMASPIHTRQDEVRRTFTADSTEGSSQCAVRGRSHSALCMWVNDHVPSTSFCSRS